MAKRPSKKVKVNQKAPGLKLHKSFKRSYREDYKRELRAPGLMHHAVNTFKMIFKNWKFFLSLILLATVMCILLVGMMSEESYKTFQDAFDQTNAEYNGKFGNFAKAGLMLISTVTTGGLSDGLTDMEAVFMVIIMMILWLVTVYGLRHMVAGKKIKLRDALYNALAPLLSTLCLVIVVCLQMIPIIIVLITYSVAVSTEFLAMPFYALIYFIFAALMTTLSVYLVSGTVVGLVAVTVPGTYPMTALKIGKDVLLERRIKFIIRLVFMLFMIAVIYVVVMLPIIVIDLWVKAGLDVFDSVPFVSFCLLLTTMFVFVYAATYIYLFYRRMIASDNE